MIYFFHGPHGPVEVDYRVQDGTLPTFGKWKHPNQQHWHDVRAEAFKRDCGRCVTCNESENLNVHHRTYLRWGCELVEDVTTLCRGCHVVFHNERKLAA